ncbi:MAG: hypothetical protein ACREEM_15855 [Blastocatellia bacterium]
MNNQPPEQVMSFILEQQAKLTTQMMQSEASFSSQIARINESHAKAEHRISELESALVTGVNLVNSLRENLTELSESHKELAKSQKELAEAQKKAEVEMAEQRVRLDETNERLDIFINVLERYISESRNGKQNGKASDN